MDHRFTFSIFTIEINGRPTVALQAKRHTDAERLCEYGRLRTKLSTASPVVRCRRRDEAQVGYRRRSSSLSASNAIDRAIK